MRKRSDLNQAEVMNTLRKHGVSVACLSSVGGGVPDILCSVSGKTFLVEVKNILGHGTRLTPAEKKFISNWQGSIFLVTSAEEMEDILTGMS